MCGFSCFVINKSHSNRSVINKKFQYYLNEMINRGPDFSQKKSFDILDTNITVGFNRLAIQDLSDKANTIFYDANNILLFNGEIYNYKNLKNDHFQNDKFLTNTDTELLFKLLKKFKEKAFSLLEGIFSISFIDLQKKTVLLARDFTGTKPLYFLRNNDGFFYSSECWFLYSMASKQIDETALKFYLTFGFNKEDTTLIKNVKKVRPGTFIQYSWLSKSIKEKTYFSLNKKKYDENNLYDLDTFFYNIIKKNLLSDTRVGTLLSGGIDSTIVTLYAKKIADNVESFTTCFLPEKKYEKFNIDLEFSKTLSKQNNIKLHINYIDQNTKVLEDFEKITNYFEEPTSNLNFLNLYWLTKDASNKNFKVILTGDGGDEMFLGYDRYQKTELSNFLSFFKYFNKNIKSYCNKNPNQLAEYIHGIFKINNPFKSLSDDFKAIQKNEDAALFNNIKFKDNLDIINYFDARYWLTNENNYKLDKCSMINSVEARVPLQDIKIIENFFFLKKSKKFSFFSKKKVLNDLKILPNYIKKRKKIGYFSPERAFLDNNLEKITSNFLFETNNSNLKIFQNNELKKIFQSYEKLGYKVKREVTTLILLQIWSQKIDRLL